MKFIVDEDTLYIAKLRKIFASEKGKIGLFWLSKDFSKVFPSNIQSLEENIDRNKMLKNLSVQKKHKDAWLEFDKEEIKNAGGNPEAKGWRSLSRGFVSYSITKENFFIVAGKWITDDIVKNICKSFNITQEPYIMHFPDYDNIIWEEEW